MGPEAKKKKNQKKKQKQKQKKDSLKDVESHEATEKHAVNADAPIESISEGRDDSEQFQEGSQNDNELTVTHKVQGELGVTESSVGPGAAKAPNPPSASEEGLGLGEKPVSNSANQSAANNTIADSPEFAALQDGEMEAETAAERNTLETASQANNEQDLNATANSEMRPKSPISSIREPPLDPDSQVNLANSDSSATGLKTDIDVFGQGEVFAPSVSLELKQNSEKHKDEGFSTQLDLSMAPPINGGFSSSGAIELENVQSEDVVGLKEPPSPREDQVINFEVSSDDWSRNDYKVSTHDKEPLPKHDTQVISGTNIPISSRQSLSSPGREESFDNQGVSSADKHESSRPGNSHLAEDNVHTVHEHEGDAESSVVSQSQVLNPTLETEAVKSSDLGNLRVFSESTVSTPEPEQNWERAPVPHLNSELKSSKSTHEDTQQNVLASENFVDLTASTESINADFEYNKNHVAMEMHTAQPKELPVEQSTEPSQEQELLFTQEPDREPLPWEEQNEVSTKATEETPDISNLQESLLSADRSRVLETPGDITFPAQTDASIGNMFPDDSEVVDEELPWQSNQRSPSLAKTEDLISSPDLFTKEPKHGECNYSPERLSSDRDSQNGLLPWEGVENEDGDSSVIQHSINAAEEPKKFSFLENDDDLLDDDDSFLDSDEDLAEGLAVQVTTEAPHEASDPKIAPLGSSLQQRDLSKSYVPTSTPAVPPKNAYVQPIARIISGAERQPSPDKKISKYEPSTQNQSTTSNVSPISSFATVNPSLRTGFAANVKPIESIHKQLDEEKKRSDAYDIPLEIAPRKPKKVNQAKPFGASSSTLSSSNSVAALPPNQHGTPLPSKIKTTHGGPPISVNQSAVNPPYRAHAECHGAKINPTLPNAPTSIEQVGYPHVNTHAPPYLTTAASLPQKQQNSYEPTVNLRTTSVAKDAPASNRYAPSSTNPEPPKNVNAMYQYPSQSARIRAFSNVSNGSIGSFGSSNSQSNVPPTSRPYVQVSYADKGLQQDPYARIEHQAPLVPALKTAGLSTIGQAALSPNTQRRSHARSNSSVYAPAYSSKYAPTVQPQFQLPSHDGMNTNYYASAHSGPSAASNSFKPKTNQANLIADVINEQPVDPHIAFHKQFPIFHWGKSSKVVYALPSKAESDDYLSSTNLGQKIHVSGYDAIVEPSILLKNFPGPLMKNKNKNKEIQKWIEDTCAYLSKQQPLRDLTLHKVLSLKLSPQTALRSISQTLYNSDELLPFLSQPSMRKKGSFNSHKLIENDQLKVLAALQTGNHSQALELALSEGDFALALILSSLVGKEKWSEVVDIYLREEFHSINDNSNDFSANLLALIFQVSVGNSKHVVKEISTNASKENWAMNNWKIIISAVLNNVKHQSSDSSNNSHEVPPLALEFLVEFGIFLHQRGMIIEGITSFVIADVPLSDHEMVPGSGLKFKSLGSENSSEGIILSEIYEFYCGTKDPKYTGFDYLLLQKLAHSSALIECGMNADGTRYADYVALALRSLPRNSSLACTVDLRLNFVSSKLIGTNASWLGKPKLSQVWGQLDKSFNKFIGGDNEENNADESGKIFENFTPNGSRNSSKIDLSQPSSSFNPAASLNNCNPPNFVPNLGRPPLHTNVSSSGALSKGRNPNGSAAHESKYEPSQSQKQWGSTPNHKPSMDATSSFDSPIQTIYQNSPMRSKDQLITAMTPPPLFSTSSKKYTNRKGHNTGETNPFEMKVAATDNLLTSQPHSGLKRSIKGETPANAALLADLQVAPPPIFGSSSIYKSRRNSAQSRSSAQSQYSNLSSPKHVPISLASSGPSYSPDLARAESYQAQQLSVRDNTSTGGYLSSEGLSQEKCLDVENSATNTLQTLKGDLDGEASQGHIRDLYDESEATNEEGTNGFQPLQNNSSAPESVSEVRETDIVTSQISDAETVNEKLGVARKLSVGTEPVSNAHASYFDIEISKNERREMQAVSSAPKQSNLGSNNGNNPYAPAQSGRTTKSSHNPYAPTKSQSDLDNHGTLKLMDDTNQEASQEELNMFSYGGYNVQETFAPEAQADKFDDGKAAKHFNQYNVEGTSNLEHSICPVQDLTPIEEKIPTPALEPRFQPVSSKKLSLSISSEEGDKLFSSISAPVIRPSSNPSFKPFTPAAPAAEEYYDDIVENESDEDEEATEAAKVKKAEEAKKAEAKAKKREERDKDERDKSQHGPSWFGWLRKETNEKKPVKAKLGHQNTFYYDDKLQRWINKNATEEEKQQVSTPPPPPPIIKKKAEGSPKVKPRTGSIAGGAAARTAAFVPPTNPLSKDPISAAGLEKDTSNSGSPSVSPSVSLSGKKANGLEDLMSLVGNAGSQTGTRRKKKGTRGYVNVMNNM
ncbi:LANO_0E08416g1_1 [Lachancea nothofagi CBS 11611]|uniref:Protein transport protein sec16 n=1 Tax=Lachancea nothofagi CBS 11611 TaxID=1266666 RepID=A0A1G4JV85_9SACH|nr:LANO_0E08416g1_1 [Lachancea nothofagi CBS 11611]